MRSHLCAVALVLSMLLPAMPARDAAAATPLQGGAGRIVGPRGESTPVVNENNQLQLRIDGAGPVSRWASDSLDVATVSGTGVLSGKRYGFATITAETSAGAAKVIVVVVRKTPRRASRAQGDAKTDTGGNVYLSSPLQHVIFKAGAAGSGVLAGAVGQAGYEQGSGTQARFNVPTGLGVDQSARGGVYVADSENHCIRRIRPNGSVEVVAGLPEQEGRMVADRTPITEAVLSGPRGVVVVGGNLMVADTENHCVWYVELARQEVRIVAGEPGVAGADNGRGRAARFNRPSGIAVSTDGRLVAVADTGNNVVRLIAVGEDDGQPTYDVTTLGQASSRRGAEVSKAWGEDRPEDAIGFEQPESVSIDAVGNVYVIDDAGASVVTRSEERVEKVDLAQARTLGDPASVTLSGTQAFVLDAGAKTDEAVNVVEVGAPEIASVTPDVTSLAGGGRVVVEGSNFAPESAVTFGDRMVTDYEVVSARRIEMVVPPGVSVPGGRTLTVATRGGLAQHRLTAMSPPVGELAPGAITTAAGGVAYVGDGGTATTASVSPGGVAVDAAGNLYIADTYNNRVRRVDASGRITTVAGTDVGGYNGDGGPATSAQLSHPSGVAVDAAGNLYIADTDNNRVRRVDASGRITTVAGTGEIFFDEEGALATSANMTYPAALAFDAAGNLFIAASGDGLVLRVNPDGTITAVAGDNGPNSGSTPATSVYIGQPMGIAIDGSGNLYISDTVNDLVRRVNAAGEIETVAGTGESGYDGDDKPATSASLNYPTGVAFDAAGNLYIADSFNNRVRRVDASGRITTVAGTGDEGYNGDDQAATSARLSAPAGVAIDGSGNVFVADSDNGRVRRVDAAGVIATAAGGAVEDFDDDGQIAAAARLAGPTDVAVDGSGNVYIAEAGKDRVRRVNSDGRIETFAGTGEAGYDGDGGPAVSARLSAPSGVAVDALGNVYISDSGNDCVRRVDISSRRIETVAGTGEEGYNGDGMPAVSAQLNIPVGIAVDAAGNVYIADSGNNRIRRVDASGQISTVAGTDVRGYNGDGRRATTAQLNVPRGVAVDASGNLYIADYFNQRIRRVDAAGRITTVAGTGMIGPVGTSGYNGDDRSATTARVALPRDVAVDAAGNVYFSQVIDFRVRRVDASGRISAVAGTGLEGYTGDVGPGPLARLDFPLGVGVDASGSVYIADFFNDVVRAVARPGAVDRSGAPSLRKVRYRRKPGELTLTGVRFGASGASVLVNGVDVSARVEAQTDTTIVVRGSLTELALRRGDNEVRVTAGGRMSAVHGLYYG